MTPIQLRMFCAAAEPFFEGLAKACALFHIETPLRQAHFLAQLAHESGGFTHLAENLNYSEQGLLQSFPSRVTALKARELARNPEAIANFVYAERLGNGTEASGDGWRYRGRGLIQLTGRSNYAIATHDIRKLYPDFPDLEALPDAAAAPQHAPLIAGWYWRSKAINLHADHDDLVSVTRAINGGTHGLRDREQWLVKAKGALA